MFDRSHDIEHLREREKKRYGERDRAIREIVDIEIRRDLYYLFIGYLLSVETRKHISEVARRISRA